MLCFNLILCSFFTSFSTLSYHYNCFIYKFWAKSFRVYLSNFLSAWLFFFSHSCFFFLIFYLISTSIIFKYLNSSITTFLFTSRLANLFFLVKACYITSYFFNFLINFLLSFLYLQYLIYKYSINSISFLHNQHWGVAIFLIYARYLPIVL